MADYTITVKDLITRVLIEHNYNVATMNDDEKIFASRQFIFDFDYYMFDERHKPIFECKLLKHYYLYELGLETPSLWKFRLQSVIEEEIPYYNQMWESTLLCFDPLANTKIITDYSKDGQTTVDDVVRFRDKYEKEYQAKKVGNVISDDTNKYKDVSNEIGREDKRNDMTGEEHEQTNTVINELRDKTLQFSGENTDTTTHDTTDTIKHTGSDTSKDFGKITDVTKHTGDVTTIDDFDGNVKTDDTVTTNMQKVFDDRNTFYNTPQDEISGQAYDGSGAQIYAISYDDQGREVRSPLNRDYATELRKLHDETKDTGTVVDDKNVHDKHKNANTQNYNDVVTATKDTDMLNTLTKNTTDTTTKDGTDTTVHKLGELQTSHETAHNTDDTDRNLDKSQTDVSAKDTVNDRVADRDENEHGVTDSVFNDTYNEKGKRFDRTDRDVVNKFYENYLMTKWGNNGAISFSKLLGEFRQEMINVDKMFITSKAIRNLFAFIFN